MAEKQKILIVDDRKENLAALHEVLREVDAEIIEAGSGREALDAALTHDFALALLDVQMPGMTGYELAEHLREQEKSRLMPLVFITAFSQDESHTFKGYENGAVDYITKPYSREMVLGKVRIYLAMDRNRRELEHQRDELEILIGKRTWQLEKRIIELKCLYSISCLIAGQNESTIEMLKAAVDLIPQGWQDPKRFGAMIVFKGREFISAGFKETKWKLSVDIVTSGKISGVVEVCYLKESCSREEGPFLKEEREMLQDIARQLAFGIRRKQAEQELLQSEEGYRRLFEAAKDGILLLDFHTGMITNVNPFLINLLGFSYEELLNKHLWDVGTSNNVILSQDAFLQLQAQKYIRYEDMPLQAKSGKKVDVEFVSNVYQVGEKTVIQCNIRDIRVHKLAAQALRKSEEKFRSYIENAPDGIFIVDENGHYIDANSAACEVTGYSKEEILNMGIRDVLAAESVETGVAEFEKILETGKSLSDLWLIRKDGSKYCLTVNAVKLSETRILGFGKDITANKLAEKKLVESETKFRSLFEASVEGILIVEFESKKIKYANPAICQMLGWSENELINMTIMDIHPKEVLERVMAGFTVPEPKAGIVMELPCLVKDGTVFYAEINAAKIVIEGNQCLASFFRDITERKLADVERKNLEAQLQQAMKMEAVGRLAGGIAHDFNNALTPMLMIGETLLQKLRPDHPMYEDIKDMKESGERCANLTRQLLAFSRDQVGELVILNLNAVIVNMVKMLSRVIGEDVEIVELLDPELGNVMADIGQMEQILANLAINARDAMPQGGKITFETKNVDLYGEYAQSQPGNITGPYVMLAVTDTGKGMDEKIQERIFDPFFTTKEKGKGTGLGLSTVYGIVKKSKGSISVQSEPGKGSVFKIYLPRAVEAPETSSAPKPVGETNYRGSETILLVEDEAKVRKVAKRILEEHGYKILDVGSGPQALELGGSYTGEIPLVITDVIMPGMGGKELAERLLASRPKIRVLFVSGYTDNIIAEHDISEKELNFLHKPFTIASLTAKVRKVLDKN